LNLVKYGWRSLEYVEKGRVSAQGPVAIV